MYDPPTDPLSRLSASVQFSGNALGLQAALGPELAAAGGYSLVIDNPPLAPRVNINRTDVSNGFTLPGTAGGWLSLFSFSFAGPPGSTVTAEIDQSAMIFLRVPGSPTGDPCPPTFTNSPVSCELGEGSTIAGRITSIQQCEGSTDHGLEGVDVAVSSTSLPGPASCQDITDNLGGYGCEVIANEDYLIVPKFEQADPGCGLDEADIVEIAGHILGTFPFTSPWQYVAADFNLDNAITTIDQILIQKAILYDEFPDGYRAWRLIAADGLATSIVTFNLASINESINLASVPPGLVPNNDFIGVKVGDVRPSCTACLQQRGAAPVASLPLCLEPAQAQAGEIIEIALSPGAAVQGLLLHNLELQLSPSHFELLGAKGTAGFELQESGYLLDAANGYFRAIWLPLEGQPLKLDKQARLALSVKVKKAFGSLDELVRLLPRSNLFPGKEGTAWQLAADKHEPSPPWPNPFQAQLTFPAGLPGADLYIYDARGALVHQAVLQLRQNTQLNTGHWPPGVYYYRCFEGSRTNSGRLVKQ